jgi:hypothetical protein
MLYNPLFTMGLTGPKVYFLHFNAGCYYSYIQLLTYKINNNEGFN